MFNARAHLKALMLGVGLVLAVVYAAHTSVADPGHEDGGPVFLANATALLAGSPMPATQRGPIYAFFLAGLGALAGAEPEPTRDAARELGSLHRLPVADGLLSPGFLRWVLWTQVLLWAGILVMAAALLRALELPPPLLALALGVLLCLPLWTRTVVVQDHLLTAFLLLAGLLLLSRSLGRGGSAPALSGAGLLFALAALCRPTYQLWNPALALLLLVPTWRSGGRRAVASTLAGLVLPWLVIVGAWSLHNADRHGFFGVSSVVGVALSTRTARFIEAAEPAYPELVPAFVSFRDRRLVEKPGHSAFYWGKDANRLLMQQRGLSYAEANRVLAAINAEAIRRQPVRYVREVITSLIKFAFTGQAWPSGLKPLLLLELCVVGLAVTTAFLWLAYHLLASTSTLVDGDGWRPLDTQILVVAALALYSAVITAAVDVGTAYQRLPVDPVIALVLVLCLHRLRLGAGLVPLTRAASGPKSEVAGLG